MDSAFVELSWIFRQKSNRYCVLLTMKFSIISSQFCDVTCESESLSKQLDDFPPIFARKMISQDDLTGVMKEYAVNNNLLKKPSPNIISCKNKKQMLFTTCQLVQLIEFGLTVSNITEFYQYRTAAALEKFFKEIIALRQKAFEEDNTIAVNYFKSLLNRCFMLGKKKFLMCEFFK